MSFFTHHNPLSILGVGLLRYGAFCPSWQKSLSVLDVPVNVPPDHIAWRSFRLAGGLKGVEDALEHEGYRSVRHYNFTKIHVRAQHYEHVNEPDMYPLVFASELDDTKLPLEAQEIIYKRLHQNTKREWNGYSTGTELWGLPNYADFKSLEKHSKYGAWVYIFGHLLNHAATNVQFANLGRGKHREDYGENLAYCVALLEDHQVKMNCDKGSIVHISNDGLLHQASTRADPIYVRWSDGKIRPVPGASVEILQRLTDPLTGEPKEGFEVENATRLFTATNMVKHHD